MAWMLVLILGPAAPATAAPAGPPAAPPTELPPTAAPRLEAHLDRERAPVGAGVTLTLDYRLPEGARLPDDPKIEGLEGRSVTQLEYAPGRIEVRFLVDALKDLSLGPFALTYLDASGAPKRVACAALKLEVLSNLEPSPEQRQLKPIEGIIPTRPLWLAWALWTGLGVLVLLALMGLVFWLWHRAGLKARQAALLPPHVRAYEALEALAQSPLAESVQAKAFYFRLSGILKRYLEELRGFPAAEYTTEEIAGRVQLEIDRELVALLRRADLVKFAHDKPTPSRREADLQAARAYIRASAPAEDAGQAPAAGEAP